MCFDDNNKCDTSNNILWFYVQISVCDYDLIVCKMGGGGKKNRTKERYNYTDKTYMNHVTMICQRRSLNYLVFMFMSMD